MEGIRYVTDDKGKKVAVMLDLKKYGALWQDIADSMISESRRKEKTIPYETYRAKRAKRSRD